MSNNYLVFLEWKYKPENFFEGILKDVAPEIQKFENGVLQVCLAGVSHEEILNKIEIESRKVEICFKTTQLFNHTKYLLEGPTRKDVNENGKTIYYFDSKTGSLHLNGHSPRILISDKDGNMIYDSQVVQEKEAKDLFNDLLKTFFQDPTVSSMLNSYSGSINNPENELIYLFEIWDALLAKFNGTKRLLNALPDLAVDWKRFSDICNLPNIKQGRHRGKANCDTRVATSDELDFSRCFAKKIIKSYLKLINHT